MKCGPGKLQPDCCRIGCVLRQKDVDNIEQHIDLVRDALTDRWNANAEKLYHQIEPLLEGRNYYRTEVVDLPYKGFFSGCIFLTRIRGDNPIGLGCLLHQVAEENGIPVEDLKPQACVLYDENSNCGCGGRSHSRRTK